MPRPPQSEELTDLQREALDLLVRATKGDFVVWKPMFSCPGGPDYEFYGKEIGGTFRRRHIGFFFTKIRWELEISRELKSTEVTFFVPPPDVHGLRIAIDANVGRAAAREEAAWEMKRKVAEGAEERAQRATVSALRAAVDGPVKEESSCAASE